MCNNNFSHSEFVIDCTKPDYKYQSFPSCLPDSIDHKIGRGLVVLIDTMTLLLFTIRAHSQD